MVRFSTLAMVISLWGHPPLRAEIPDVFVLIHPQCHMDKQGAERALARPQGDSPEIGYPISTAQPQVLVGDSLKVVPVKRDSFVVEFPPTKVTPIREQILARAPGEMRMRYHPYVDVRVAQPYRIWHIKGANTEPLLIGQRFVVGRESPLRYGANLGNAQEVIISKENPAQLARKALVPMHKEIAEKMSDSFIDKIIAAKPMPVAPGRLPAEQQATPPQPLFKPTKVYADPKLGTVIEVDLHNRLPTRAACSLNRRMIPAEHAAWQKIPGANRFPIPVSLIHITVEAGEKKTVKFIVPPLDDGVLMANQSLIFGRAFLAYPGE